MIPNDVVSAGIGNLGAALCEPLGRSKPGSFRGRHHGEPHDRPVAHPQHVRIKGSHPGRPSVLGPPLPIRWTGLILFLKRSRAVASRRGRLAQMRVCRLTTPAPQHRSCTFRTRLGRSDRLRVRRERDPSPTRRSVRHQRASTAQAMFRMSNAVRTRTF
jgi:hypothetical protein